METKTSALEEFDWAVVSATEVLVSKTTYDGAISASTVAESIGESGVCIVAQAVADRMNANKLKKDGEING